MPQKPKIDCATIFPKIAAIIRKDGRDQYLNHWDIAQRLQHDDFVKSLATPTRRELHIGSKAVALFGAQYTRKSARFGMARYRREFFRKREGGVCPFMICTSQLPKIRLGWRHVFIGADLLVITFQFAWVDIRNLHYL